MIRGKFMDGITRYWWLPVVTGLICLGLGIWTICSPTKALPIIALTFAICLLAVGIVDMIWGFATSKLNPGWGWDICLGIIDIIAGIWMLSLSPAQMTMAFLYIVGIWLIFAAFSGLGQIFAVSVFNPFAGILAAILLICALIFSFWLIFNPIGLGVLAWVWVGIALICYGIYKISLGCKIKTIRND